MGWHWGILASSGGGAAGSFDLLQTTLISTDTASITFSSLGSYSDYKHLQIRMTTRGNSSYGGTMYLRMNSDTGSNYSRHVLGAYGSSVTSGGNASASFIALATTSSDAAEPVAEVFGASVTDILDFSNFSKNTTVRSFGGLKRSDSGAGIELRSGAWLNTAAVTSLEIRPSSGSFISGSRFSLYGVK